RRALRPRRAPPDRAVGRPAPARLDRARARGLAAPSARRRADRKPRHEDGRRDRRALPPPQPREGAHGRRRHPQPRSREAHGPLDRAPRRQDRGGLMRAADYVEEIVWSFRKQKLRTALTATGIGIGAFALALMVGLGAGLQSYIEGQVRSFGNPRI